MFRPSYFQNMLQVRGRGGLWQGANPDPGDSNVWGQVHQEVCWHQVADSHATRECPLAGQEAGVNCFWWLFCEPPTHPNSCLFCASDLKIKLIIIIKFFSFIQNNKSTTVTTKKILIFILNSKCYRKTILKKYTTLKNILVQIQILQFQI